MAYYNTKTIAALTRTFKTLNDYLAPNVGV